MNTLMPNPFMRGHVRLSNNRLLLIQYDEHYPSCLRQLHPAQQALEEEDLTSASCIFDDSYAMVVGHAAAHVLPELTEGSDGVVTAVLQELLVHEGTGWMHLCPVPTLLDPLYLQRQLSFVTGHYSRSWEISSAHVPEAVYCDYCLPAAHELKTRYFECFALTSNQSVGFKLYETPWVHTDVAQPAEPDHLHVMSALRADGVPDGLISLLMLAGEADVRFLILDPDAAIVPGLPLHC